MDISDKINEQKQLMHHRSSYHAEDISWEFYETADSLMEMGYSKREVQLALMLAAQKVSEVDELKLRSNHE